MFRRLRVVNWLSGHDPSELPLPCNNLSSHGNVHETFAWKIGAALALLLLRSCFRVGFCFRAIEHALGFLIVDRSLFIVGPCFRRGAQWDRLPLLLDFCHWLFRLFTTALRNDLAHFGTKSHLIGVHEVHDL